MQAMELEPATVNTPNSIHELLEKRFSPYAFSSHPVEPEKLRKLFEAARSAPSCYNEQPWRFVVSQARGCGSFRAPARDAGGAEPPVGASRAGAGAFRGQARFHSQRPAQPPRLARRRPGSGLPHPTGHGAWSLRSPDGRFRFRESAPTARHPGGLRTGGNDGGGIHGRSRVHG